MSQPLTAVEQRAKDAALAEALARGLSEEGTALLVANAIEQADVISRSYHASIAKKLMQEPNGPDAPQEPAGGDGPEYRDLYPASFGAGHQKGAGGPKDAIPPDGGAAA